MSPGRGQPNGGGGARIRSPIGPTVTSTARTVPWLTVPSVSCTSVPVRSVMVYLTQHNMLTQYQYQQNEDPYAPETYLPFFVGRFDAEGRPKLSPFDRTLLYWLEPIYKASTGELKNFVILHAESDPFNSALEWRVEPPPAEGSRQ